MLSSGSGEVIDACLVSEFLTTKRKRSNTHKVQHDAGEHTVDGEAKASLHAHQTDYSLCLKHTLLYAAHFLCSVVAYHHMPFPGAIMFSQKVNLRPVLHDDTQIVVAM